jgi:hypothetical protein
MEPFEECQICGTKWHRICAMHSNKINPEGFICDPCRIKTNRPKPENRFTAKSKQAKNGLVTFGGANLGLVIGAAELDELFYINILYI